MARIFREAGHKVFIFDAREGSIDWREAAQNEVVLISVPLTNFEEVITKLGPHTRPDGLVFDIGSLKEQPIQLMLDHCRGEVIGAHPLFGPLVQDIAGHTIFLCPARSTTWIEWLRSLIGSRGATAVDIDPVRHDRLMSRIQVLRHMFLFCFGRSLMHLGFDLETDAPLAGPWFSALLDLLNRQLDQKPDLYADLALLNPEAGQVFDDFLLAANEVAQSFGSGDRNRIIGMIDEVSAFMRSGMNGGRKGEGVSVIAPELVTTSRSAGSAA